MLYKLLDNIPDKNIYEDEIEFIKKDISNIEQKIVLCNKAINDKKIILKEIKYKYKLKNKEIEYNKWIKDLENKEENEMLELAKQQVFFKISDSLFNKYFYKIKKQNRPLFVFNLSLNYDTWEFIEKYENDEIYMFTLTESQFSEKKIIGTKFNMDFLLLPNVMEYINKNLPIQIFYSNKKSYFISEKLKNNGFSINYIPDSMNMTFNLLLEFYMIK